MEPWRRPSSGPDAIEKLGIAIRRGNTLRLSESRLGWLGHALAGAGSLAATWVIVFFIPSQLRQPLPQCSSPRLPQRLAEYCAPKAPADTDIVAILVVSLVVVLIFGTGLWAFAFAFRKFLLGGTFLFSRDRNALLRGPRHVADLDEIAAVRVEVVDRALYDASPEYWYPLVLILRDGRELCIADSRGRWRTIYAAMRISRFLDIEFIRAYRSQV